MLENPTFLPPPLHFSLAKDEAPSARLASERQIHTVYSGAWHFPGHKVKSIETTEA